MQSKTIEIYEASLVIHARFSGLRYVSLVTQSMFCFRLGHIPFISDFVYVHCILHCRYLLFTYPVTAALFGVGTNMFFLVIMFILSWQRFNPTDKTATLPSRILTLEERKDRVKARMEREMLGNVKFYQICPSCVCLSGFARHKRI